MKKRNLKSLELNKKVISKISHSIRGGHDCTCGCPCDEPAEPAQPVEEPKQIELLWTTFCWEW